MAFAWGVGIGGRCFLVGEAASGVGWRWVFGVQVLRIEGLDPRQHLAIMIITKVIVLPFPVPSVKGVVPDHVEGGLW